MSAIKFVYATKSIYPQYTDANYQKNSRLIFLNIMSWVRIKLCA